jgi:uncharacterized membrane protein
MLSSSLVLIHISGAVVGMISGALSMIFRKGSGLHRAAGTVFFVSMLSMSAAAVYLAIFTKPNAGNAIGAVLTFYLVATGWMAARRRDGKTNGLDVLALLIVALVVAADSMFAYQAATSRSGMKYGYRPALYIIFGSIAFLFAVSDVRMIARGGVFGARRIARHLWRMCLAFLFALLSFYPTRARLFPAWVNDSNIMFVPHILLVASMTFWMFRMSRRKRAELAEGLTRRFAPPSPAMQERAQGVELS